MTADRVRFGLRRVLTTTTLSVVVIGGMATPAFADPSVKDLESKIEAQANDLEGIVEDYNAINEELDDTKEKIEKLEKKLAPYEKKLDKLYDESEPMITTAYETHHFTGTLAVINAGSPDQFTDRMTALNGATATDSELIKKINDAKKSFAEDKAVLEELKAEQASQEEELESKKDKIEKDIDRLQKDRKDVYRDEAAQRGQNVDYIPDYVAGDRGVVVRHAMDQIGDPYVWASAGPDSYDCSGLILDAYRQVGISLPHQAAQQYNMGTHISRDQLQPGDAVFYNGLQHVAMYIGDGYVVHAPTFGDSVKVQKLEDAATPYYGATTYF